MNYGELQSRTLSRLGVSSDDPIADEVANYVNEGIHYLETMAPEGWPWMREAVTMTTTVAAYTFTQIAGSTTSNVTVSKILSVRVLGNDTYWQALTFRSIDEAYQLYPVSTEGAPPESYTVDGSILTVYPTPDQAYTVQVRVVRVEPDLDSSTAEPIMPFHFHGAIVDAAALVAYQELQDRDRIALYEQRVSGWVDRMRRYGNQSEGSPKIRVREQL